ncbi:unnamed protein product [Scytosiphon promiscuus]
MMDPEDNDSAEELEAVPSDMFDSGPSPVSGLGGWATGAGSALFAVTKGVSSRVEGVSSRMSLRAKDMLASVGDDPDNNGNNVHSSSGSPVSLASPNGSLRNGEGNGNAHGGDVSVASGSARNGSLRRFFQSNGGAASASGVLNGIANEAKTPPPPPTVDETEVSRLVSSLSASPQLAEKMVAMNKLSSVLGDGGGKCSQSVLRSVAAPLVVVMRDAEHFDPFFANACIGCTQQLLDSQGAVFATELVEEGAVEALIPLLHPRFELIRIQGLAFLEALLKAERGRVCAQLVGVPAGMQALVDLLDDRWDEVRHQTVSLLAAFLTGEGGVSAPIDLQNFVAFQDGFDKLFKNVTFEEHTRGDVSLQALAALTGTVTNNPLSRKLFLAGGHLSRLPSLLVVLRPGDVSDRPLVQPPQAAASTRRRWGWGGGRDRKRAAAAAAAAKMDGHANDANEGEDQAAVASPSGGGNGVPAPLSSPAMEEGAGAGGEKGRWSGKVPVARIRAALSLLSALCGCAETAATSTVNVANNGGKHGFQTGTALEDPAAAAAATATVVAGDEVRSAIGRERGLLAAVCELALASPRAPAGGGPTWADYGLPEDCQRSAMEVLATLIAKHPENQAFLTGCKVRGAPISVNVHGQKQLISSEPRNAVNVFLELWLAASSAVDEGLRPLVDGEGVGKTSDVSAEVATVDRALDAFLVGNTSWCRAVFAGISSTHSSAAKLRGGAEARPPTSTPSGSRRGSNGRGDDLVLGRPNGPSGNVGGTSHGSGRENGGGAGQNGTAAAGEGGPMSAVGGAAAMSAAIKRGLLCEQPTSSTSLSSSAPVSGPQEERSNGGGGGGGGDSTTEREEDDEPMAAALRLRLFRRVLQAGGADARAVAANVGLPTEGSRRQAAREQDYQDGREKAMQAESGAGTQDGSSPDEPEGTADQGLRAEGGEPGVEAGRQRDRNGWREGRISCSPPLTPALEVAVRLLADGYKCAVMLQTSVPDSVNKDNSSPPSDLTHYLISLGELVVTWLSPEGVGPALSQRLLASGSTWALLRTIGRAFRPDTSRRKGQPGKRRHSKEVRDLAADSSDAGPSTATGATATASASRLSDDPSLAYLHALVAVVVGSFVSAGTESLAKGTLSGGISKHIGVFEFCRILDAASDWVSFSWPGPADSVRVTREGGSTSAVPAFWALSGDSTFSAGLVEMVHAAHAAMIEQIVAGGLAPKPFPAALRNVGDVAQPPSNTARFGDAVVAEAAAEGGTTPSAALQQQGGGVESVSTEGGGGGGSGQDASVDEKVDITGSRQALEELLRRQQVRIEELEHRLLPHAVVEAAAAAAAAAARGHAGANADQDCEHPTLTI